MSRLIQIFCGLYPAMIQSLNYFQYSDANILAIWETMKFSSVGYIIKGKKPFFRMIYTTKVYFQSATSPALCCIKILLKPFQEGNN